MIRIATLTAALVVATAATAEDRATAPYPSPSTEVMQGTVPYAPLTAKQLAEKKRLHLLAQAGTTIPSGFYLPVPTAAQPMHIPSGGYLPIPVPTGTHKKRGMSS
ncbi:hypothetical protein BD830_101263 [Maritimibacter alkaliphilus HTCC2654]|uniref:DUF4148 domain-containing protein n=1 Tax=Maritimibacter alkaliphilus HTCC2654 TaxID=314271 RepID=A3VED6_9RHOB|nr:hypothetical protein [Maritimibacter alkaliphilus]EAQ13274.1 hypothetical protein RB2654_09399 [Rhodobacterales bacterium HTCC2654] [Maritimibacter alkaliphilus HTCC2654]TYP85304.1 hypothetical protein BD830_101263 [Maritimibacter alkaliphilus HTCC2654]